jgi:hypothetical protein
MGYTGPLADKDRIFTNVYGFQEPWLKAAQARGDWDDTKALFAIGPDAIIDQVKASGLRGRGGGRGRLGGGADRQGERDECDRLGRRRRQMRLGA